MNRISIKDLRPAIFADITDLQSEVWDKDIHFEKGNSYLIEAASGKGKSSLCSFIFGYRKDFIGDIYFDKYDIKKIDAPSWNLVRSRKLSLLFQGLNLFPELSAFENVLLKNNLTGYKSRSQIKTMFETLGIEDKLDQKIGKMSWGQQQRVAVIRCLCQPFEFLILDEPISHLDNDNAIIISNLIQQEALAQGAGIITTSIGKHLHLDYSKRLSL